MATAHGITTTPRCERCNAPTARRREFFQNEHWEWLCTDCWVAAMRELVGRIIAYRFGPAFRKVQES